MTRVAKHHESAKLIVALTVVVVLGGLPALGAAAVVLVKFAS